MDTDYAMDFQVLAHLRGYPEELQRFSNLVKQIHPRGQAALDFLLKRPSTGDFVEAVCRLVRDGVAILSAVEAAELSGLPPREFLDRVASRADFPAPLFRKEHRAVWRRADVDAYLRQGREAPPS